jgi:hypothetical protein
LIINFQNDVLYGSTSPARTVRAGLQVSPALFELMMNNACVNNDDWYYTMVQCTNDFYNGIMRHGLLGAMNEYLLLTRRAFVERRQQMAASAEPGGPACVEDVNFPELSLIQDFTENFIAEVSGVAATHLCCVVMCVCVHA